MINAKSGLKNDSICKSLTGLTIKEFDNLLPSFEEVFWEDVNSKPRVNIKTYSRFNDGRFGHCARLRSFFGYKNIWLIVMPDVTKLFTQNLK